MDGWMKADFRKLECLPKANLCETRQALPTHRSECGVEVLKHVYPYRRYVMFGPCNKENCVD